MEKVKNLPGINTALPIIQEKVLLFLIDFSLTKGKVTM